MTAYQTGGLRDRQQRVAQLSQDIGQLDGILPSLLAGAGDKPFAGEFPLPALYQAAVARQQRVALVAQDIGQLDTILPTLEGAGATPTLNSDQPLPSFARLTAQQRQGQAAQDFAELMPRVLRGADAGIAGSSVAVPPRWPYRRPELLEQQPLNLALLLTPTGALPPGQQRSDLPLPPAAQRARDYTFLKTTPLDLIGKDVMLGGAPGEVPSYDWSYQRPKPVYLQGTGEPVQDLLSTLLVQAITIPQGQQQTTLPRPPRPPRLIDYTWVQQTPIILVGQDALVGGSFTALPPGRARRLLDYTLASGFPLELIGRDASLIGSQVFDLPRGPRRLRDYTWTHGFEAESFPSEAVPIGAQMGELPPPGARRARDYSFIVARPRVMDASNLTYVLGEPQSAWHTRAPNSRWSVLSPRE